MTVFPKEVATVLTVYGIETAIFVLAFIVIDGKLQQYLPFTVLKLIRIDECITAIVLQQYLPFTVLKRSYHIPNIDNN